MNYQDALDFFQEILSSYLMNISPSVGKRLGPQDLLSKMDFSIPKKMLGHEQLIQDVKNYLKFTPNTITSHFQNQLFSGLNPYALCGDWISTFTNSTMATYEVAPVATMMEKELVKHLNDKIGWTNGDGLMVTGGSNSNFVAMLVARNLHFPETKIDGLQGKKFTAFVSEEAHYSFDKAANMLGLGLNSVKKVPSDEKGKMNPVALRELILSSLELGEQPYFIGATAGTTVLGAYDPIFEISEVAREFGIWFHVDGAWGGSVILSKKHKSLMNGISNADSMALDTHKMLGTGLISSFFLTRHYNALRKSNHSGGGDYIFHENDASAWDLGPSSLQCGRRVDAFKIWLMWRSMGDEGIEKMIDGLFQNVQLAKLYIESRTELQLLQDPEMLNICFAFKDESLPVAEIRKRLLDDGEFYVNISTRRGKTFFRMILVNPMITEIIIIKTINKIINMEMKS